MSKSARSVLVFGFYLVVLGYVVIVAPNFLLRLFSLPGPTDVWIRVVGMLVLLLGFYYIQTARQEMIDFSDGRSMPARPLFSFYRLRPFGTRQQDLLTFKIDRYVK